MQYTDAMDGLRVREADEEGAIFYALKFTLNKQGQKGVEHYSLCLPSEHNTFVFFNDEASAELLGRRINRQRLRNKEYHLNYPEFSRIDVSKPESIPDVELTDFDPRGTVFFEEMSKREKSRFLETLVKGECH